MNYLLDTNTCIYALKNTYPSVKEKFALLKPSFISIPSIVKSELLLGAYKSKEKKKTLDRVLLFIEPFGIIPFGDKETTFYAQIRSALELKGHPIGPNDYIIAATAMSNGLILITHNTKEFSKIEGLLIQDWCQ